MKSSMLFTGLALALVSPAAAVTVEVNGIGPDTAGGPYASLTAAIQYTNTQGEGPHIINITADQLGAPGADGGEAGVLVTEAITINGDADGDDQRCLIYVDMNSGEPVTEPASTYTFLEIATGGDVTINDVIMVPDQQGNHLDTRHTSCINIPGEAGVPLNFSMNNSWITGSDTTTGAPKDPTVFAYASARLFYGSIGTSGGSGIHTQNGNEINVSLTNTAISHTRGNLAVFKHRAGSVSINEGCIFSVSGSSGISFHDMTDAVTINVVGSESNRIKVWANRNSATVGDGIFVGPSLNSNGKISNLKYVDAVLNGQDGIDINEGQLETMEHVRASLNAFVVNNSENFRIGSPLNFVADISNSTFHDVGKTVANNPRIVEISAGFPGTVNYKDCIFSGAGRVINNGATAATVNFTNCAIVTEGTHALVAANPFSGQAPDSNVASISADPEYVSTTFSTTDGANVEYLRPGNETEYAGKTSTGGNLTGGAGGTALPVSLSQFSIE